MANILNTHKLPDAGEVEKFVDRAEEVAQKVKDILNGTSNDSKVEKKEECISSDVNTKNIKDQIKDKKETNLLISKNAMDATNEYLYYCKHCGVMYYYEIKICVRCRKPLITRDDRQKELDEKIKRYKIEKEGRDKRRQKWEELTKENAKDKCGDKNSRKAKSTLPNYDKWAYFEPDSDSDVEKKLEHSYVFTPDNQSKINMLEKSISNDIKKRKENRDIAYRFKLQGNKYAKQKQYLKAIECYEQGIKLCNDYIELYTNLSICLIKVYQFKKAVRTCNTAIKYLETFPGESGYNHDSMFKAYSRKGLALFHLYKYLAAFGCFQKAVLYSPQDETVRRYIWMCHRFIEDDRAVRYYIDKKKKGKSNKVYRCSNLYSLETNNNACCKSLIKYMDMTEEQVMAMKVEDFVEFERITSICENTEAILCLESEDAVSLIKLFKKKIDNNKVYVPVFFNSLKKILCNYMDKLNEILHGDVLKNQNVYRSDLATKHFDMKINAEHIIEGLSFLAQNNPLYIDSFIECAKPVLTFYVLKFINYNVAMFFLGTIVRCVRIANEVRRLIKNCHLFWNMFFEDFDYICKEFATLKDPKGSMLHTESILEMMRITGIKKNYFNYFLFLGRMCLEAEVNELLTRKYLDNILLICKFVNDRYTKNDGCVFYYTEYITNLYLGGGQLRDEIYNTSWDGIFHILKYEKDKVTLLMVLNYLDVITCSWPDELQKEKPNLPSTRKIEPKVFENMAYCWKKNEDDDAVPILKMLARFFMFNSYLNGVKLLKATQEDVDVVTDGKLDDMFGQNNNSVNTATLTATTFTTIAADGTSIPLSADITLAVPPANTSTTFVNTDTAKKKHNFTPNMNATTNTNTNTTNMNATTTNNTKSATQKTTTTITFIASSTPRRNNLQTAATETTTGETFKTNAANSCLTPATATRSTTATTSTAINSTSTCATNTKTVSSTGVSTYETSSGVSSSVNCNLSNESNNIDKNKKMEKKDMIEEKKIKAEESKLPTPLDKQTVNLLISITYDGLNIKRLSVIHKECAVVLAYLPMYPQFYHYINERETITIIDLIKRVMDIYDLYEEYFKKGESLSLCTDIVAFFSRLVKYSELLKNTKEKALSAIEPLLIKLLHLSNVTCYKPLRENMLILFSVVSINKTHPEVIKKYALPDMILRDRFMGELLNKCKRV